MRKLFLIVVTVCAATTARTQSIRLVADIWPGGISSSPNYLTAFGNTLFFGATSPTYGHEFYRYDPATGPVRLTDLVSGVDDGIGTGATATGVGMGTLGSKIYFPGAYTNTGIELFSYDTASGMITQEADIYPGTGSSSPGRFLTVLGKLYFTAYTAANGSELYSYDGINPPVLYDLYPGPSSSAPSFMTVFQGKIYFTGGDNLHGRELFSFDPATGAYALVQDLTPGTAPSIISSICAIQNKLYFSALIGISSRSELYSFDGNTVRKLSNMAVNGNGLVVGGSTGFPYYNGDIYFMGSSSIVSAQLYKYSIASDTVTMVYDIYPNGNPSISNYIVFHGTLYFTATTDLGKELWKYDGTNCSMVADFFPGNLSSSPSGFTICNDTLFFTAANSSTGTELYKLVEFPATIQNVGFNGSVKVYPCPATSTLMLSISVQTPTTLSFDLVDAAGRAVYTSGMMKCNGGGAVTSAINICR